MTEPLRGRDLGKVVNEDGAIAPPLVVEYLRQAARALDEAHATGIVHRDLAPENLFLTTRDDGTPCVELLGFGVAPLTGEVGLPGYRSPEQMTGKSDRIGPPTDVWALGLIAFRLLVAGDFWPARTGPEPIDLLSDPIPTPSERGSRFGPGFDSWFADCVNRDPDARFRSAGEAVRALAAVLGVEVGQGSMASIATPAPAPPIGPRPSLVEAAAEWMARPSVPSHPGREPVDPSGRTIPGGMPAMAATVMAQPGELPVAAPPKSRMGAILVALAMLSLGAGVTLTYEMMRGSGLIGAGDSAAASASPSVEGSGRDAPAPTARAGSEPSAAHGRDADDPGAEDDGRTSHGDKRRRAGASEGADGRIVVVPSASASASSGKGKSRSVGQSLRSIFH